MRFTLKRCFTRSIRHIGANRSDSCAPTKTTLNIYRHTTNVRVNFKGNLGEKRRNLDMGHDGDHLLVSF
jgi:hypothetical protein